MDDAVLIEAIKKHKETCFHKSTCEICRYKFTNIAHETPQCDICGFEYDPDELEERYYRYECKCGETSIEVCANCFNCIPFEIVLEVTDEDESKGIYIDVCCPLTKGVK